MVRVKLMGGLGNQLFQYSVGRRLSIETATELVLDLKLIGREYEGIYRHDYQLDPFNISAETAVSSTLPLNLDGIRRKLVKGTSMISPMLSASLFDEYRETTEFMFDSAVFGLPGDVCLNGYWQSWKYFQDIRESLLSELSIDGEPEGENRKWAEKISKTNAISLHVRRGDYVSMGIDLPSEYYRRALRKIALNEDDATVFVFSDDIQWVKDNEDAMVPDTGVELEYVTSNDVDNPQEDMRLMWSCDHNIISNSTFSWWGAWLNRNEEKQVIAPQTWFSRDVEELDIVPPDWETVGW